MKKKYYYLASETIKGPVSIRQLRLLLEHGKIDYATLIREGGGEWIEAKHISEIWTLDSLEVSTPRSTQEGNYALEEPYSDTEQEELPKRKQSSAHYFPATLLHRFLTGLLSFGCAIWVFPFFWPLAVILCVAGLLAPFMTKLGAFKGNCPHCDSDIQLSEKSKGLNCKACKKRIIVRGNYFIVIE